MGVWMFAMWSDCEIWWIQFLCYISICVCCCVHNLEIIFLSYVHVYSVVYVYINMCMLLCMCMLVSFLFFIGCVGYLQIKFLYCCSRCIFCHLSLETSLVHILICDVNNSKADAFSYLLVALLRISSQSLVVWTPIRFSVTVRLILD